MQQQKAFSVFGQEAPEKIDKYSIPIPFPTRKKPHSHLISIKMNIIKNHSNRT